MAGSAHAPPRRAVAAGSPLQKRGDKKSMGSQPSPTENSRHSPFGFSLTTILKDRNYAFSPARWNRSGSTAEAVGLATTEFKTGRQEGAGTGITGGRSRLQQAKRASATVPDHRRLLSEKSLWETERRGVPLRDCFPLIL
jgi:hypothetical protein